MKVQTTRDYVIIAMQVTYLESVSEVLQPRFEDPRLSVDVRDAEHQDSSAQVVIEVHALGYLRQENHLLTLEGGSRHSLSMGNHQQ